MVSFPSTFRFGSMEMQSKLIAAAVIIGLPAILLSVVLLQPWAEPKWMFLDTLTAAELSGACCSVYFGFMSNLGILLWCGTAATCLVAATVFLAVGNASQLVRFTVSAGLLTGWFTLDDMFLLHERVLPALGIPQELVIAAYGALALAYLGLNWRFLAGQEWWILLLGVGGLGVSILVDTIFHSLVPGLVYLEDGAKFFGIFCWASFHILTVLLHLVRQTNSARREECAEPEADA